MLILIIILSALIGLTFASGRDKSHDIFVWSFIIAFVVITVIVGYNIYSKPDKYDKTILNTTVTTDYKTYPIYGLTRRSLVAGNLNGRIKGTFMNVSGETDGSLVENDSFIVLVESKEGRYKELNFYPKGLSEIEYEYISDFTKLSNNKSFLLKKEIMTGEETKTERYTSEEVLGKLSENKDELSKVGFVQEVTKATSKKVQYKPVKFDYKKEWSWQLKTIWFLTHFSFKDLEDNRAEYVEDVVSETERKLVFYLPKEIILNNK